MGDSDKIEKFAKIIAIHTWKVVASHWWVTQQKEKTRRGQGLYRQNEKNWKTVERILNIPEKVSPSAVSIAWCWDFKTVKGKMSRFSDLQRTEGDNFKCPP